MNNDKIIELTVGVVNSILLHDPVENPQKVSELIREIHSQIKKLDEEDTT